MLLLLVFFGCGTRLNLSSLPSTLAVTSLVGDAGAAPLALHLGKPVHALERTDLLGDGDYVDNQHVSRARTTAVASLTGAWLGAWPVHLDWMEPWQAWPLSVVFTSLICCCVAPVVHLMLFRKTIKADTT